MSSRSSSPSAPVRVRFAPSPTGHFHLGGARTALFNWLYARNTGGDFILRIEDSDLKRSRPEMTEDITEEMKWLGLDWDRGPFFQSNRADTYRDLSRRLLDEGRAYEETSPQGDGKALIYRVERDKEVSFEDMIRGTITFSPQEIKDIVLLKSDGSPTYNFACVADDHDMKITHVIRGEDHIPNTPKQLMLYRAFGWPPPSFAHLPLILGADKAPLSKRHGATSLKAFRMGGFLPAALRNYLALLGWSPGDGREFIPTEDLIRDFSLSRVIKRAAVFDYQKLIWLNGKHIQATPPAELAEMIRQFLERKGWHNAPRARVETVVTLLGHRLKTLKDILEQGECFFSDEIHFEPRAVKNHWEKKEVPGILRQLKSVLSSADPFREEELEKRIRGLIARDNVGTGEIIHPLRVAVTGREESPGIFKTLEIIGRRMVLKRLDQAIEYLEAR